MKNYVSLFFIILVFLFACEDNPTESKAGPLELTLIPTHVSYFSGTDGAIDLTVSGGSPPYQYQWSNGKTTEDIDSLAIGIYSITVTDNDMQSKTDSVSILQSPHIEDIISEVNLDSLTHFVNILSGEISANINGTVHTILSRHKNYPGNNIAADYIHNKLEDYGLTLSSQVFSVTGRNVYGLQTGTDYPDQHYIICAHYDSMPDSSLSPGADDNASGTAAVLEAARIMQNYSTKYSIIYALWDEEEQGLIGARNYALRALSNNENIVGVLNMDMIGWDSNNDGRFWVNVRDTANSVHMSDRMIQIHDEYNIGLSPQVLNPGSGSDNVAFWLYGFPAIGVEEMYGEDWNDHYHLTSDKIEYFNMDYFHKISKLVISTTASLAEVSLN
jgi:Peptidase family M28/SprB repeat